ncbi:MFS general substrate transporter [Lyophyllum atratum]|nr:MFS general substrate transporter [Lyophyllum atratum]
MVKSHPPSVEAHTPDQKQESLPDDVQAVKPPEPRFDGGPRAWATLVGGFFATTATFGYLNAFGVYQDVYTRANVASASRISWIGSTQLFFILAMGLPAGKFLDMGYFRHTVLAGSVIYVFSLFMVSLAHHDKYYQIYLAQGLGMGIGAGLLYVPALAIQAHHWRKRRGLAMGIVVTGTGIGGIVIPIMLNQLFKSSVGFEWGVRASAFMVLGLLTLSNILMCTNPALEGMQKPKPDMKGILTDVPYILANLAVLLVDWGIFFPYFYLQLFAILHGVSPNTAFYMLAIMNAASIPGRIVPNHIADKVGPYNAIIPATFGCAVLMFAMLGLKSVASMVIFAILYGFFSGGLLALCGPLVATLCRDPSEVGVRIGLSFASTALGALTGTPIDGALLGHTFPWFKAVLFNALTIIAGAVLLTVSRHMIAKRKGTQLV